MVRLTALSNRLHAIIEVAGDRPGAAGGGHDDESLLLAVLEHELQAARDEFEDEDTDRHPGRTDQTLEQVLATVQRTVRDAPPGSGLADQAAALEREVRAAIAQGPLLSVNLNDPAVAGVPPSKTTPPPGVALPGFTPPPKLPDKWVFIPPLVELPNQTVFIPPAVDQQPLHLQQTQAQSSSQATPEQDVTPGIWERLDDTFEHAPKPNATTTITALGLGAAGVYALSRTWIGQLILLFSTVPGNSLKGIPPSVSGAATPG